MRKLSPLPGSHGFTLIELMIVVAVIGILLAIGVPNYQEYVLRSKLTDALSSLSQLRVRRNSISRTIGVTTWPQPPPPAIVAWWLRHATAITSPIPAQTNVVRVPAVPLGQAFLITATGVAAGGTGQFTYTIDEANNRQTTSLPAGRGVTPANCWLTAKGQTC
jgi:type IV pilus assembly protein PilE